MLCTFGPRQTTRHSCWYLFSEAQRFKEVMLTIFGGGSSYFESPLQMCPNQHDCHANTANCSRVALSALVGSYTKAHREIAFASKGPPSTGFQKGSMQPATVPILLHYFKSNPEPPQQNKTICSPAQTQKNKSTKKNPDSDVTLFEPWLHQG